MSATINLEKYEVEMLAGIIEDRFREYLGKFSGHVGKATRKVSLSSDTKIVKSLTLLTPGFLEEKKYSRNQSEALELLQRVSAAGYYKPLDWMKATYELDQRGLDLAGTIIKRVF